MSKSPQQRKEPLSLRIEPKIKYLVEIASRVQRRNISNYVEYVIEESLKNIEIKKGTNLYDNAHAIWAPTEAERVIKLHKEAPNLLTFEEEKIMSILNHFYKVLNKNDNNFDIFDIVNEWEIIKQASFGDQDIKARIWLVNKVSFIESGIEAIMDIPPSEPNEVKRLLGYVINKIEPTTINDIMMTKAIDRYLYLFIKDDKKNITIDDVDIELMRYAWGAIVASSYASPAGEMLLMNKDTILSHVESIKTRLFTADSNQELHNTK